MHGNQKPKLSVPRGPRLAPLPPCFFDPRSTRTNPLVTFHLDRSKRANQPLIILFSFSETRFLCKMNIYTHVFFCFSTLLIDRRKLYVTFRSSNVLVFSLFLQTRCQKGRESCINREFVISEWESYIIRKGTTSNGLIVNSFRGDIFNGDSFPKKKKKSDKNMMENIIRTDDVLFFSFFQAALESSKV